MKNNLVPFNLADFYKTGHPAMYPAATTTLVANFTPRTAKYAQVLPELFDNKVVWFGLQGFIKEYLIGLFQREFFDAPAQLAVRKFARRMNLALGPGVVAPDRLIALHELGYLPLEIRSIPEGERVNIKVPPVIFINTHPDFPWVSTYFETLFSAESWKPSTVATLAFEYRKLFTYYAALTGVPAEAVNWQGHDFSMRGMSGVHDAMRCGVGHLLSFTGTDTIPAIDYAEDYYGADADEELIGGSIPATEHSVMTLRILRTADRIKREPYTGAMSDRGIRRLAEREVIRELVSVDYPDGMVSIVADSFDYWATITEVAEDLKEDILARGRNALGIRKVVFRPDSGDPVRILAGYRDDELILDTSGSTFPKHQLADGSGKIVREAERRGSVQCLWDIYGGTTTDKGYKVLDDAVGLIYGDSITLPRARDILRRMTEKGFASSNVVFGIGSFTYNMLSRDTFGWAMKAVYAEVGGEPVEIFKDPATDDGTKRSAKGLPRVEKEGSEYVLHDQQTLEQFAGGELRPVFRNGELLVTTSLAEMRDRLLASWDCPEPNSITWNA